MTQRNAQHIAFGRSQTMEEWGRESKVTARVLRVRIARGLTLEQAIEKPPEPRRFAVCIEGDVERRAVVEMAAAEGVTRQAIHLSLVNGMARAQVYDVLWACFDWMENTGVDMTEAELVNIAALVIQDAGIRSAWVNDRLTAGHLCLAAKRMSQALMGQGERE